jgi:hypothetical protein
MHVDDELASYLVPGPFSIAVAGCNAENVPETVRGWGAILREDRRTIDVCVGREPAKRLIEILRRHDRVAVSIANVTTYQAVQLKGRCVEIVDAEDADRRRVREHGEGFVAGLQRVGLSETAARGLLVYDVMRLRIVPDTRFNQTPGPGAGMPR